MNIKNLKQLIESLPDDMEVILQKDSEGNGYSPLSGGDPESVYFKDSSYSGDVYNTSFTAEELDMDEDEWEKMKVKNKVLVLYPVN